MIKLDIKPYCEDCSDFDADVDTTIFNGNFSNSFRIVDTTIRCSHAELCSRLVEHLQATAQNNEAGEKDHQ